MGIRYRAGPRSSATKSASATRIRKYAVSADDDQPARNSRRVGSRTSSPTATISRTKASVDMSAMIRPMSGLPDWRDRIDDVSPTVLVLGGFLTSPPFYRAFRQRLLHRGAAGVVIANIWTPEWLLAGAIGLGPIVRRAAGAFRQAVQLSAASPQSGGAPILVVGHSAGGMVARLLTAERPFAGRRTAAAARTSVKPGAIVTLGTPHRVGQVRRIGRRVSTAAAAFAEEAVPGATFAPAVGYLSVASRAIVGRPDGDGRARIAFRVYRDLLPSDIGSMEGDGVVPLGAALLDGARHAVLDDIV